MPAPRSTSFDRAATNYDATRRLSPKAMENVVGLLTQEIAGRGPCLEVGIGTGRIGLMLWEAGVDMAGVDLSAAMLGTLVRKAGGSPPFPLAVADATRLPFPNATFQVCLACHVLHLIPEWKNALMEMARVLRPQGTILVDPGSASQAEDERVQVMNEFARLADVSLHPGMTEAKEVDEAMATLGLAGRQLTEIVDDRRRSLEELIRGLEEGIYSFTWPASDEAREEAGRLVRQWARERFGNLEVMRNAGWSITWRAYVLPG
jgi:SAM-dependent methyltransferase